MPPDDDFLEKKVDDTATKRLHSIFYDDVSETQQAVKEQLPTPKLPKDVTDKATPTEQTVLVSKLQRPQIKIKVQALLPNAGGMSSIRKSLEQQKQPATTTTERHAQSSPPQQTEKIEVEATPPPNAAKQSTIKKHQHTLTHVCKGRVRAPINRRPWTRRARHENYQQSVKEAAEADEKEDSKIEAKERQTISVVEQPKTLINKTVERVERKEETKKPDYKNLFLDDDDDDADDDLFFKAAKNVTKPNTTKAAMPPTVTVASNKPKVKPSLFDASDDNDDDGFSKNIFAKKPTIKQKLTQQQQQAVVQQQKRFEPAQKSLFFDEESDSDDDLFKSAKPYANSPIHNAYDSDKTRLRMCQTGFSTHANVWAHSECIRRRRRQTKKFKLLNFRSDDTV